MGLEIREYAEPVRYSEGLNGNCCQAFGFGCETHFKTASWAYGICYIFGVTSLCSSKLRVAKTTRLVLVQLPSFRGLGVAQLSFNTVRLRFNESRNGSQ